MRKTRFAPDEYYHLCNRGNRKQNIFLDNYDRARFLFLLLYGQSPKSLVNVGRHTAAYIKNSKFSFRQKFVDEMIKHRMVDLICFSLMDNHFHVIVKEVIEKGVSRYMQKVLDAYTKYFNAKYDKNGHLFGGPFRAVHIADNDQFLYASAYVHRNPREIKGWRDRENTYPWSSYQDYNSKNRWGLLLPTKDILEQFKDGSDYHDWVKGTNAKENLDEEYLKETFDIEPE